VASGTPLCDLASCTKATTSPTAGTGAAGLKIVGTENTVPVIEMSPARRPTMA
jgi:hypothetical protein